MKLTASKLRENIYKIIDGVLKTGQPVEIERNGQTLKLVPSGNHLSRLKRLKNRKITSEDSANFEHIDWSSEWSEG